MTSVSTPTSTRRRTIRRRVLAVLSGGLVLGVGAAWTLAAWTDNEYAGGTITSGTFGVEGSTNGSAFSEHASSGAAATLVFTSPASAMYPGAETYTAFWVRTVSSSLGGTVKLSATASSMTGTGLQNVLTYGVKVLASGTTCNAANYTSGTTVAVADGTALVTTLTSSAVTLAAAQATPVQFCFKLVMSATADNTTQGKTAIPVWQFAASS